MSFSTVILLLRAALLLVSFVGLCATVRTRLKVDRFIAPYAVACGVTVLLMIGGMLRVLAPAFWLIYAAGFAGFIYTYFIRRERPEYGLIAALVIFAAFLVWRFYPCPLSRNDDLSHWGLVARHLLRHDAFPDKNAPHVFFQSYPLGAASFIYYIGKSIANTEGIYLVAQELLQGLLFLPMLAHIRENRRICYPLATALFLVIFSLRNLINLEVDVLLSFFGIGTAAAVAHYRDDLKKALPLGLVGMIAVVYVKNSGLFFALTAALLLGYVAWRCGKGKRTVWSVILLSLGAAIAAYLLWMLHIRISYTAAMNSKHAVSLNAYARQAGSKGLSVILQIGVNYILNFVRPSFPEAGALAIVLACALATLHGMRRQSQLKLGARQIRRIFGACIGVYALWSVMVYFMYIFSMPEEEALRIASFFRYNSTGLIYMLGLVALVFFNVYAREGSRALPLTRVMQVGSVAFICVYMALFCFDLSDVPFANRIYTRETDYNDLRRGLVGARIDYELPYGGAYAMFCRDSGIGKSYNVKYEFETADLHVIAENPEGPGEFLAGTYTQRDYYTDLSGFFAETMDRCNALLVMDKSPAFEAQLDAFLETYRGDTPVIYTYEY